MDLATGFSEGLEISEGAELSELSDFSDFSDFSEFSDNLEDSDFSEFSEFSDFSDFSEIFSTITSVTVESFTAEVVCVGFAIDGKILRMIAKNITVSANPCKYLFFVIFILITFYTKISLFCFHGAKVLINCQLSEKITKLFA